MKKEIKILITGDFYAGGLIDQLISEARYNEIFNDFLPIIKESDIAITNLESALTNETNTIEKTGPALKASNKTIDALKYAGFNMVTLANNHIMDYGAKGLTDSLKLCTDNNIEFIGAGINYEEASKILYKSINGKKLAFINIAENEWSTTQDNEPGANPLNPVANFYSIKEAKSNADYVFVIVHGGHEHYELPSPRMKETYRFFIDAGADTVVGHHTHCFSGFEIYNTKSIFYSLGNFIFDKKDTQDSVWNSGFAVQFTLSNNKMGFTLHPYIQNSSVAGVHLLTGERKKQFTNRINQLNSIITDENQLMLKFEEYCLRVRHNYSAFLEPHRNKYLFALQYRNLFPSLLSKRKRLFYLNLIRCESHRDVLLKTLKK